MEKTTTVACSFKRSNWRRAVQRTLEVARLTLSAGRTRFVSPGGACTAQAKR